ncbi:AlkA N-terminal domain-containing protein [Nocardioides solisilvae]|uniref:AlkA N-terminal domain-containing protein n=1 Tax=Nocardioides solisilvae TaxID=1542435 RepID=UPI000D7419AA|nr:AlkA N-terminal domain-containing protein [Nocardioides solisilvae]
MTRTPDGPGGLDPESCYRAVRSRDRRFDGVFYTAVRTTGIYCRPSCPARTPGRRNVTFHPTAAAAQAAGYRACKRCLPDAVPGSPGWDAAADVAGRAMRLVADGVVDRDGVEGLAASLGYSPRHLGRLLVRELGAGPLALARARRAQTARALLQGTDLRLADVAFAAGFSSVRQFNDTVREVYGSTPSDLRGRGAAAPTPRGTVPVRLAVRTPFAGAALREFLARRAVPGVELVAGTTYSRTLRLPHGPGTVSVELRDLDGPGTALVPATFVLADLRDTSAAVERVRRLLDADCDPVGVAEVLGSDPLLGGLLRRAPGLRVPGHVDGAEVAFRAVLGQQVSVAAARTAAARLAGATGEQVVTTVPGLDRLFPEAGAVAALDPGTLPMPRARGRALVGLAAALAGGGLRLDRGADRDEARAAMLALPGIGPWTADYVGMRALGHPDLFLPTDTGTRDALRLLGLDPAAAGATSRAWRPWRSYAQVQLWHSLSDGDGSGDRQGPGRQGPGRQGPGTSRREERDPCGQ